MKKIKELNIDELLVTANNGWLTIQNRENHYISSLKCFKNCDEITVLEAKKINLLKTHKSIFINFENLYVLDLRENKLSKISKSISCLKQLKVLRLDYNQITFLPNSIGLLENLEILTVSNNELKSLPISIQNLLKLKTLKISNNKISKIPIEIGHLKYLECLHIDSNYFSEIPTTIYYLKHLNEFCFEWFEYLEPPFQKTNKDNIGKTIIQLIKNSLQELLKQNILFCDFNTFVEKNSNKATLKGNEANVSNAQDKSLSKSNNTEQLIHLKGIDLSVKKISKLFLAIENNYYGVIKAFIESNSDYLVVKNKDNKNLLHFAMNFYKLDIIDFILSKTDFSKVANSHVYLHKAIRMRDPILVMKLLKSGISVNSVDDQGNNCFHILFSAFNKNFSKCTLIGDVLLQKECKLNLLNNDLLSPVHIAIKKSSKECIVWIINQNKILKNLNREIFDLNARGKNNITPLHLASNLGKLEEILLLIESGSDILAKTLDNKTPRKSQTGNYFITKILRNVEMSLFYKKYFSHEKIHNIFANNKNCFTTVEEISNYDDISSMVKINRNKIEEKKENVLFSTNSEEKSISMIKLNANNILSNMNRKLITNSSINSDIEASVTHNGKEKNLVGNVLNEINDCGNDNNIPAEGMPYFSFTKQANHKKRLNTPNLTNIVETISSNNNSSYDIKTETPKFKKTPSIYMMKGITVSSNKYNTITSHGLIPNNIINQFKNQKVNYHFYKEILLNNDSSLSEKNEALMYLRISNDNSEIDKVLKLLIENLDYSNCQNNSFIFADLCQIMISHKLLTIIPLLERFEKKLLNNDISLLNKKKKESMLQELKNCLNILTAYNSSEILKRKREITESATFMNSNSNYYKNSKSNSKINEQDEKQMRNNIEINQFNLDEKEKNLQNLNKSSKVKNMSKYFQNNNNKGNDEFNYEDMNEISNSHIDLKSYTNHMPKKLLQDVGSRPSSAVVNDTESCNVADTSRSCIKFEEKKISMTGPGENDNNIYNVVNIKANEEKSFLEFDNN